MRFQAPPRFRYLRVCREPHEAPDGDLQAQQPVLSVEGDQAFVTGEGQESYITEGSPVCSREILQNLCDAFKNKSIEPGIDIDDDRAEEAIRIIDDVGYNVRNNAVNVERPLHLLVNAQFVPFCHFHCKPDAINQLTGLHFGDEVVRATHLRLNAAYCVH